MRTLRTIIACTLPMLILSLGIAYWTHVSNAASLVSISAQASPNTVGSTETTYTFTFTAVTALENNGQIHLEFPKEFLATTLANNIIGNTSVTGSNITGHTVTVPNGGEDGLVVIVLTTSGAVYSPITITIGDGGGSNPDLINPASPGLYGLHITTYNGTGDLLDNGLAFVEIDDTILVDATISESLIMELDTPSLTYALNPGVANGQDLGKTTTITVTTNASDGYNILGKLDDGNGVAALTAGAESIFSHDAVNAPGGDNYFGYSARNANTIGAISAERAFTNIATTLSADGSNQLGHTGTATAQKHILRYDLNVDYLQAPGVYSGTITYTVSASF